MTKRVSHLRDVFDKPEFKLRGQELAAMMDYPKMGFADAKKFSGLFAKSTKQISGRKKCLSK